jgi:acyl-coenzyme A synthetase/AMP-(fatty) acid ligase
VLYTSGSTGKPKGVEVHHRGLVNVVWHFARQLEVTPDDAVLGIASFSFDMSAVDIWLPLTQGATLRVASQRQVADAVLLRAEVDRATLMQATPSTWLMLIEAGWTGSPRLRAVCGGEALTWQLAAQLVERTRRVWNNYGPTETTVWSMCWPIDLARRAVSLGHAISNTRLYVLDADLEPVPVGVPGELCIGGVGVARGYWDRPELTRERFVADPFAETPGQRMYRTGDRVRWALDGTIEYVERLDFQVKVRGFRIELGEIEAALESHPGIRRGAVIAERSGLDARLAGYYVAKDGARLERDDVRRFLAGSLPGHMVPSLLIELPELPLSPNGKVDRPALARLERPATGARPGTGRDDDALVRALAGVWQDVLGVEAIDVERTFFEHGGTSLQLVRVQRRLAAELKIQVTVAELFAYPSIEHIAGHLAQRTQPASVIEPPGPGDDDGLASDAVRDRLRDLEALSLSDLQRAVSDGLGDLLDEES